MLMRKVTSLAMLGLLCFGSANVQAQNFVADGAPTTVTINRQKGTLYRSNSMTPSNNGQGGAKWISNEIPGLWFIYANGTKNQFNVTETNVNPDWNANDTETYDLVLTGEDSIRYGFLSYTATSGSAQLITVGAPTQVNHTFSATSSTVTIDYTSAGAKVNKMSFRNITGRGNSWTNGTITISLQKYKTRKVVFEVQEDGQAIYTSDSMLVRLGDAEIPQALTRPLTTLTLVTTTIDETTDRVVVNATFASPFDKASQQAGVKYLLRDNNSTTQHFIKHQEGNEYTTTTRDSLKAHAWQFEGNPYTGVAVKSVMNGKYLTKVGNYAVAQATTADETRWIVNTNGVNISQSYRATLNQGGFILKHPSHQPLNVNGGNKKLSYWSDVDANSHFFVEPLTDVQLVSYVVKENGQNEELFRDSVFVPQGNTRILSSLKRPLTTLTAETTTVGAATKEVVVRATFAQPFDKASQTNGKKFVVKLENGYYLNHQEGDYYVLRQVADFPESYQWKFEGNPYTGVRVRSVQTGGYLIPSGDNAIARTGVTTEQSTWEVNLNTVTLSEGYTVPANGFTLKHATKNPLNVNGSTKILSFWGTVDGNSVFMVDTVPSDFKPLVLSSYQAVADAGAGIFKLTEVKYNEFLPLYTAAVNKTTAVTYEEYRAIKTIVETEANYQLPETGYYRVKNANVADRYMNLEGTMLRASKNRADVQRDASSVIYVKKQEDGTYLLNTTGRTLAVVSADNGGNKTVFADNNAIQSVTMSLAGLGKGYLQIGTNVNGYLFYWAEQANRVHTYSKNYNNTGQWSFEPAKTVTVPLNSHEGKSYATACFPFPVSISTENVKAYNVVPQGATGRSNMEELATEIPVGTPMLLVSETAADSVTFTIGESAPTSTEPTTAAFKGNFLGQTVTANTLLTLGRSSSTPQKVGFYKYTGTTLAPFRAYFTVAELTALLAGANGFSINFDDLTTGVSGVEVQTESTGSVYDLAGRKVTKATKGLYIINGKKVIR